VKESIGVHPMAPTILVAGRIVYQKGIDILLDAVPFILKHVPTAMFVFAGDGEMRWDLEASCRTRGIHQNTRWLGKVAPADLRKYFKMCDALCVPSRNEPFGIVILEAWAAGKPVVASRNGGPGEIVTNDKTGYVVDATPESVAWGVGHIFANFEHARWMGKNGHAEVEARFTWDKIAEQTLEVYANGPVKSAHQPPPKPAPAAPAKKEAAAPAEKPAPAPSGKKGTTSTPRRPSPASAKKRR
jgi:glycosyltransferase involved in cell wall biosynthesis